MGGVVAVGKSASTEYRAQRFQIRCFAAQGLTAGGNGGGDIFGALQAPLDLKAGDTQRFQLPQPVGQGQILQRKGVAPSVALKIQSAGLGTAPAVAAALAQHAAEVALTGNAHAQRPVDENLAPQAGSGADGGDLLFGKLPRQHHLVQTHFLQQAGARQIVDGHLGAAQQRQGGVAPAHQPHQPQILHQYAIHAGGCHGVQCAEPVGQLTVGDQRIQGDIDLNTAAVAPADGLRQGVFIKIFGARAGIKAPQTQINGIGAAQHSGTQLCLATCRRQNFSVFFHRV